MRRLPAILMFAAALSFAPYARAQEKPEAGGPGMGWQVANFVILAGILGYMIAKNAGTFFAARTGQIQRSLAEAATAKKQGEERVAEMERRIAKLADEIERMRATMRAEIAAEGERIRLETERHIHRIQEQAEQDIESMMKTARRDLKMYSAELALKLAEEQLKARITGDVENSFVSSFIADLRAKSGAGNIYN